MVHKLNTYTVLILYMAFCVSVIKEPYTPVIILAVDLPAHHTLCVLYM